MTSCHELLFICIPLFRHAYIMRIPSFAMSFSYQIGASPDCHRFICHLHFRHLSPRHSVPHLYVSLSISVSHYVRLCQTVQTEYIRISSPIASLFHAVVVLHSVSSSFIPFWRRHSFRILVLHSVPRLRPPATRLAPPSSSVILCPLWSVSQHEQLDANNYVRGYENAISLNIFF